MAIRAGDLLCGRYLLEATIGRGGMGEVFSASVVESDPYNVNIVAGMRVAVKVVNRLVCDDLLMARLEREAQAARLIHSEYVPALLAVDRTPDESKDGKEELFLVLQLLHGQSFSQRLKSRGGFLPWEEVQRLGEDMLHGLIDAHRAGIVHRDLKPGNVFLSQQPGGGERAMILDFGVCKVDGSDGDKLTVTGESLGTVSYMAPEQIRGASKVDERADLYSFAMVVFEALSGRLAHDASGQMAMLASKLERSARSIREVAMVPIPVGLEAVLRTCLARKPSDRYPSAQELLKVWRTLGKPVVQPRPQPPSSQSSMPSFPHVGSQLFVGTQSALTANTIDRAASGSGGDGDPHEQAFPRTRRTPVFMAAGAVAAAIMVMGAVALGRAPTASDVPTRPAGVNVPAAAATTITSSAEEPRVAIVPAIATAAVPSPGKAAVDLDLDDPPSASGGAPSVAAPDTAASGTTGAPPKPAAGSGASHSHHGKKRPHDGVMTVAPF